MLTFHDLPSLNQKNYGKTKKTSPGDLVEQIRPQFLNCVSVEQQKNLENLHQINSLIILPK